MPRRKKRSGFSSQLLAFGAGVAVGANWPRTSNFVGFILQRLGLELTDLALWMWDPEKSISTRPEKTPVMQLESKRSARTVRKKAKGTVANRRRTNPARSKKVGRFLPSLLPADASLN
jgi:hypothetical protein